MMNKFSRSTRRPNRGQALVEFALVLPVLLMLLMVLIEVARLFSAWLIVENSAREAARYAVTGLYDKQYCYPTGTLLCDDGDKTTREAAQDAARLMTIKDVGRGAASGTLVDYGAPREQRSTSLTSRSAVPAREVMALQNSPTGKTQSRRRRSFTRAVC